MLELTLFNLGLFALMTVALIISKKKIVSERGKNITLLVSALLTIACHYSSLLYHWLSDDTALQFLYGNPNLILPIYPCNVVMWCCLIFGLIKKKDGKFGQFLIDFIFWFGVISSLVGMFANVDFVRNPSFANYDVTKGIVAHAFMLYNIMLLPVLGFVKIDLIRNQINIVISIVMMYIVGLYCNLVCKVIGTEATAYNVNSMFIIHSPFEGVDWLTFPIIGCMCFVAYFIVFLICDFIAYKKGNRFISRLKSKYSK